MGRLCVLPLLTTAMLGLVSCGGSSESTLISQASLKSCVEGEGAKLARAGSDELPSGGKQQKVLKQGGAKQYRLTSDPHKFSSGQATIVLYKDESTAKKAGSDPALPKQTYSLKQQAKNALAIASAYDDPDSKTRAIVKKCVA